MKPLKNIYINISVGAVASVFFQDIHYGVTHSFGNGQNIYKPSSAECGHVINALAFSCSKSQFDARLRSECHAKVTLMTEIRKKSK